LPISVNALFGVTTTVLLNLLLVAAQYLNR